ncbi:uncharacterized protein LOC123268245 isoform X1 [Cotesia glomerata]|uniref:Uncharacterized protein n=1 Tax=Cotesia glomerata TaxID=32391 RepID=A0AAV7I6T2_COTGL|nr:uncharacterized protein LOC123268245 isoform X1 [Cotesia glomerata]KAH0546368.1 hypothetical protein KQX54_008948 [Cotesia glomerata]
MLINRLSALTYQLTRRSLLQRVISRSSTQSTQIKNKKRDDGDDDDDDDKSKPIPYSTSPAAEWLAQFSQQGGRRDEPWYQPYIVLVSSFTFFVYFVYLREANDYDELLDRELGDHFPDLKEADIRRKLPPEIVNKKI